MLRRFLDSRFWKGLGHVFRLKTIGDLLGWWTPASWIKVVSVLIGLTTGPICYLADAPLWILPLLVLSAVAVALWIAKLLNEKPVAGAIWVLVGLVVVGGLLTSKIHNRPPEPFRRAYQRFATQLGSPVDHAQAEFAYQGYYDHATIIWSISAHMFYRLPRMSSNENWSGVHEVDFGSGLKYYRDDLLRPQFYKLPADRLPPYGGVAYQWLLEKNDWEWIGWRLWDCYYYPDSRVFIQNFQNGLLVGPLRKSPNSMFTEVVALFNNNNSKWGVYDTEGSALPTCYVAPYRIPESTPPLRAVVK